MEDPALEPTERMLTIKYFVRHPSKGGWTNFDTIAEQLGRARRFRNFLVEKRRERLAVEDEEKCASPLIPTYTENKAQFAAVYKEKGEVLAAIKKRRSVVAYAAKMGGGKADPDDQDARLQARKKELDAKRKALGVERKALNKAFWDQQKVDKKDPNKKVEKNERIVAARQHEHDATLVAVSGLHAPTYLNLLRAFEASVTDSFGTPSFKKIEQMTLAEQGPMKTEARPVGGWTYSQFHTENGGTWIEPVPEAAFTQKASTSERGQGKRVLQRTFLNMRVGRRSKGDKERTLPDSPPDALYARIPVLMHRPIPKDGIIKNVFLHCRGFGHDAQWSVTVQVALPIASRSSTASGVVGVDVGWAKLPNGDVRVAVAADTHGNLVSELVLPAAWAELSDDKDKPLPKVGEGCSIMAKVEHLKSVRDRLFDEINHDLIELEGAVDLPKVLEEKGLKFWAERVAKSKPSLWNSNERMLKFVRECHEVFPEKTSRALRGLGQRGPTATAWYHREIHLSQMENGLRKKFYDKRDHLYQQWALSLAQRYTEIHLEKNVLKVFSTGPAEEKAAAALGSAVRRQKNSVAVSTMTTTIRHTFGRLGGVVRDVEAAYTSQTCSSCGHIDRKNRERRQFDCTKCGLQLDADHNGAVNIARSTKFIVKEVKKRKSARRKKKEPASAPEARLAA